MTGEQPDVGVLVLRVERQDEYVLITVTVERHLGRGLTVTEPAQPHYLADGAAAIDSVRDFLSSFR